MQRVKLPSLIARLVTQTALTFPAEYIHAISFYHGGTLIGQCQWHQDRGNAIPLCCVGKQPVYYTEFVSGTEFSEAQITASDMNGRLFTWACTLGGKALSAA